MKSVFMMMLILALYSTAFSKELIKGEYQEPKLIDCQTIKTDERSFGGKLRVKTICFYRIEVGTNQSFTLWQDHDNDNYGILNSNK